MYPPPLSSQACRSGPERIGPLFPHMLFLPSYSLEEALLLFSFLNTRCFIPSPLNCTFPPFLFEIRGVAAIGILLFSVLLSLRPVCECFPLPERSLEVWR